MYTLPTPLHVFGKMVYSISMGRGMRAPTTIAPDDQDWIECSGTLDDITGVRAVFNIIPGTILLFFEQNRHAYVAETL